MWSSRNYPEPNDPAPSSTSREAIVSGGRRPAPGTRLPQRRHPPDVHRGEFVLRGFDLYIDPAVLCVLCSEPLSFTVMFVRRIPGLPRVVDPPFSFLCVLVDNHNGSVLLLGPSESFHVWKQSRVCGHAHSSAWFCRTCVHVSDTQEGNFWGSGLAFAQTQWGPLKSFPKLLIVWIFEFFLLLLASHTFPPKRQTQHERTKYTHCPKEPIRIEFLWNPKNWHQLYFLTWLSLF